MWKQVISKKYWRESVLIWKKSVPKVFNWSVSFFLSDFLQNPYFKNTLEASSWHFIQCILYFKLNISALYYRSIYRYISIHFYSRIGKTGFLFGSLRGGFSAALKFRFHIRFEKGLTRLFYGWLFHLLVCPKYVRILARLRLQNNCWLDQRTFISSIHLHYLEI